MHGIMPLISTAGKKRDALGILLVPHGLGERMQLKWCDRDGREIR